MTAQEDSAILEVLVRMTISKLVDFSRTIVMRTGKKQHAPGRERWIPLTCFKAPISTGHLRLSARTSILLFSTKMASPSPSRTFSTQELRL